MPAPGCAGGGRGGSGTGRQYGPPSMRCKHTRTILLIVLQLKLSVPSNSINDRLLLQNRYSTYITGNLYNPVLYNVLSNEMKIVSVGSERSLPTLKQRKIQLIYTNKSANRVNLYEESFFRDFSQSHSKTSSVLWAVSLRGYYITLFRNISENHIGNLTSMLSIIIILRYTSIHTCFPQPATNKVQLVVRC